MVIVAAHLDDSTERMIDFLTDSFGVPVNAVLFQPFEGGLIGRTWLRPDSGGRNVAGRRSASHSTSREESKLFWDAWLPVGRPVLSDIRLPQNGPRSVLITRRIIPGIPSNLTVWVAATEAYAEISLNDEDPELNSALLNQLRESKAEIESVFGADLDWRDRDEEGLMTRRTKIVSPRIDIGVRTEPTREGLEQLADAARRLVDAVKPHLRSAVEDLAAPDVDPASDSPRDAVADNSG